MVFFDFLGFRDNFLDTITIVILYGPVKLDYTVYKNVPEIFFTPKKIRVLCFIKKLLQSPSGLYLGNGSF
jgi:hypothetical protein